MSIHLLLLSVVLVLAASSGAQPELLFTAIPDQDESTFLERADAVTNYLQAYLQNVCHANVSITYRPVSSYQDAVDGLVDGIAHFGWYGGLTGVQAGLRSSPAYYVAQRLEDTQFTSVFLQGGGEYALLPMGIESANNKSLAFGSSSSTSGYLMPAYYMSVADPPVIPSSTIFTGSHDLTIDAVMNGTVEVGVANSVVWNNRVAAGTVGGTSAFYTTPTYSDYLWVAGASLPGTWAAIESTDCADIHTVLTEAFLAATTEEPLGEALLTAYSTVGYVSIAPGEYTPIEETGCGLDLIEAQYCPEPLRDAPTSIPTTAPTSGAATLFGSAVIGALITIALHSTVHVMFF